jgi:DNA-directed RNA polymerase alpha subunit
MSKIGKMANDFFESINKPSQDWLNALRLAECRELERWLKERIKYLDSLPFIKKKIEDLNLSFRAYNALKSNKLHTVEDIIHFGIANIPLIRNIGAKTVVEIKQAIAH